MEEVIYKDFTIRSDGTVISPSGHVVGYTINNKKNRVFTIDGSQYRIDWLVACFFGGLSPDEEKYYIKHKNGDYNDCSIDNLEILIGDDAKKEKSRLYVEAFRNSDRNTRTEKEIYLIDLASSTYYITTISKAADRLNKSKTYISRRLDGSKIDGRWRITDSFTDVWNLLDDFSNW